MTYCAVRRVLLNFVSLLLLCATLAADTPRPAPQFSLQTLEGETYSNASLWGKVVLLQFWATWCKYCRRDQPAVDSLTRAYSNRGLVVMAVDVDEPEATVRDYLRSNPRTCRVALDDGGSLAARFGAEGFPYYVAIDANGNIAGVQSGAGGEASLQQLLGRAGLFGSAGNRGAASASIVRPKMMDVPGGQSTMMSKPLPKTIFVFTDGSRLESHHYTLDETSLHVVVHGQPRTIALSTLDMKTTLALNHEHGIDLNIPKGHSQIFLAF